MASTEVSSSASAARSVALGAWPARVRCAAADSSRARRRGQLAAGHVDAQRLQLGDHVAVAAGGVGLALERAQLAPHLAQQVLERG